jgi:hypothetical protein
MSLTRYVVGFGSVSAPLGILPSPPTGHCCRLGAAYCPEEEIREVHGPLMNLTRYVYPLNEHARPPPGTYPTLALYFHSSSLSVLYPCSLLPFSL